MMIHFRLVRALFVALAALVLSAGAQAQLFRAYLSSSGSDSNPCDLPHPCRLLPAALAAVASGGEIWMLDSANYNTASVSIGKSASIMAVPGAVGSILAIGGPAVSITVPSLKVALRNVVITPLSGGGGTNGVSVTAGSTVFIEDSLLANLPAAAVYVNGWGTVEIANSIIRNNNGYAVDLFDGATAAVSGTQMLRNAGGLRASSSTAYSVRATVSDSLISGGNYGVLVNTLSNAAADARVQITRCTVNAASSVALQALASTGISVLAVSASMIVHNGAPWAVGGSGGMIKSFGNNHFADNTQAPTGSLTTVAPM